MRGWQRVWRNYGLSIVLAVLFAVSLGLQTWMGWRSYLAEQAEHGQAGSVLGSSGYIWTWGEPSWSSRRI
jgi:hypothetical protein